MELAGSVVAMATTQKDLDEDLRKRSGNQAIDLVIGDQQVEVVSSSQLIVLPRQLYSLVLIGICAAVHERRN